MAEVIPSSVPILLEGKTKKEDTEDAFKPKGSLTFRINNFREFSKSSPGKLRICDAKVSVRGLTFWLAVCPVRCVFKVDPKKEYIGMGIVLKCGNISGCDVKGDGSWNCLASMTLQIKTLLEKRVDLRKFTHRFSSKEKSSLEWEEDEPWSLDFLVDPENGLYNEKEDTLELIAEISVDAPAGVMELPKTENIQVNDEMVFINKNQLAMHSPYFHKMFYNGQFDEGKSGEYKVEIGAPATVEHFKRMIQTMYPENKPLDDQCIEGVLHLANRFLVTVVEGKCLEFLMEKSMKPALFKYRVGDKYGYTALKDHMLRNLNVADFKMKMLKANMVEYAKLDQSAAETFMARFDALIIPESEEED